jgi:integrase/recombinase XerD
LNVTWELTPEKFLDRGEIASLLRKADELWSLGELRKRKDWVRDAFLIHTALSTGLRNSEICDLKVTDLRIGNGSSYLIVQNGKGSKQRRVHIGTEYKRLLKRYLVWKDAQGELAAEAYLLRTKRSSKFCKSALWRRWTKYCPQKTLHSARHTFATMAYAASGQNLRLVQKALGHSRITTTQIYADVMPEVAVTAMNNMDRLLRGITRQSAS